jgi:hypothetical protein
VLDDSFGFRARKKREHNSELEKGEYRPLHNAPHLVS